MNDFDLTPDDPKLTAYALGELEGGDLAAVEEALRRNPALRATVAEIRAAATQLEAALAAEPDVESVTAAAAASPMHELPVDEYRRPNQRGLGQLFRFPQIYFVVGGLAAACFAVIAVFKGPHTPVAPPVTQNETKAVVDPSQVPVTLLVPDPKTGEVNRMTVAVNVVRESAPTPAAPAEAPEAANRKSDADSRALIAASKPAEETKPVEVAAAPTVPAPVEAPVVTAPSREPSAEVAAVDKSSAIVTRGTVAPEVDKLDPNAKVGESALAGAPATMVGGKSGKSAAVSTFAEDRSAAERPKMAAASTGSAAPAQSPQPPSPDDVVQLSAFSVSSSRSGARALGPSNSLVASAKKLTPPKGARFSRSPGSHTLTRDNDFIGVEEGPKSMLPAEVDVGSYPTIQAAIKAGRLPARETVKIEELVNYFPYRYAASFARADDPFGAALEVAEAPWAPTHRLVRIGLKGRDPSTSDRLALIAKDVKIEVTFNPKKVSSYRLIGFENPRFDPEAYKTDGPEISAGHVLTALYEIVPIGAEEPRVADKPAADNILYQGNVVVSTRLETASTTKALTNELLLVTVGYRKPTGLISFPTHTDFSLFESGHAFADASPDFKFAAAVAEFGMILRNSPHKGTGTLRDVVAWAGAGAASNADDPRGYRSEFIALAQKAQTLLR